MCYNKSTNLQGILAMLDQTFGRVYTKFKLHFYKQIFSRFEDREATLTTVESFCMEVIMALGEPTIAQFSHMMNLSTPTPRIRSTHWSKRLCRAHPIHH